MNFKVGTLLAVSLLGLTACGGSGNKEITAEEWKEKAAAVEPVEYTKVTVSVKEGELAYSLKFSLVTPEATEEEPNPEAEWQLDEGEQANIPEDADTSLVIMAWGMIGENAKDFAESLDSIPAGYEVTCYSDLSLHVVAPDQEARTIDMSEYGMEFTLTMQVKDVVQDMKFDVKDGAIRKYSGSQNMSISGIPEEYAEAMAAMGFANGDNVVSYSVGYSYSK